MDISTVAACVVSLYLSKLGGFMPKIEVTVPAPKFTIEGDIESLAALERELSNADLEKSEYPVLYELYCRL